MIGQYSCERAGSDTAVVFIHGILGSPGQFEFLVETAEERGLSVLNLLLPGHGGSGRAFADSNLRAWSAHVDEQISRMREKYTHIYLVGHSMGGLLAIRSYLKNPDKIEGIFCLALPLYFRRIPGGVLNILKVAFNRVKETDAIALAAKQAYGVTSASLCSYIRWVPRFIELFSLSRSVRSRLKDVRTRLYILQSAKDEYISKKAIPGTAAMTNVKLPYSGHFYYHETDRRSIKRHFSDFLQR